MYAADIGAYGKRTERVRRKKRSKNGIPVARHTAEEYFPRNERRKQVRRRAFNREICAKVAQVESWDGCNGEDNEYLEIRFIADEGEIRKRRSERERERDEVSRTAILT